MFTDKSLHVNPVNGCNRSVNPYHTFWRNNEYEKHRYKSVWGNQNYECPSLLASRVTIKNCLPFQFKNELPYKTDHMGLSFMMPVV